MSSRQPAERRQGAAGPGRPHVSSPASAANGAGPRAAGDEPDELSSRWPRAGPHAAGDEPDELDELPPAGPRASRVPREPAAHELPRAPREPAAGDELERTSRVPREPTAEEASDPDLTPAMQTYQAVQKSNNADNTINDTQ